MKTLFLIPARGGSKGLPGKNIKLLNGKPLIYYTIDAAREVSDDTDICVSTDDLDIVKVVEEYNLRVPFIRPPELATDSATSEQVLTHAIQFYESKGVRYDYVVLLQPTSPLRSGKHIKEALQLLDKDTEMIAAVKETDVNPYYVLFEEDADGLLYKTKEGNFIRRQDCPKVYELNGSIYIINVELTKRKHLSMFAIKKYLMDKKYSFDIDDKIDFVVVESIIKKFCE